MIVTTSNLVSAVNNCELLSRQHNLLMRSAQLRASLCFIQTPLSLIGSTKAAAQWLGEHPGYSSLALGGLLLLKPRRAWLWTQRLRGGWIALQRAHLWL